MNRILGVAITAVLGVGWPSIAAAEPAAATLQYTCQTSSPFSQPMTAQLSWDTPRSVRAGTAATVDVTATLGSYATWLLGLEGVASVEGSGTVPGTVVAPGKTAPTAIQLTMPRTDVPSSGPMTVHASGSLPRLVLDQPGHATIDLANDLAAHMIPRDASGNVITAAESDISCGLDPGQHAVVLSLDVTSVPAPPTAAKTTAPAVPLAAAPAASASETGSATPTTTARPTATPTITLRAKSAPASTGTWRIGPIVLGVAAIGVITALLWLKRRSRSTDPGETPATANHGRDA
ncbi:MAG TPA: DUF6801 domain-containing protein [Pseudonocardiaceae bacterium]|nr:DUF6801 domain-containing protein [Pseudonocardiaceae bacterium]